MFGTLFKIILKLTKVKYGKNLRLKGVPVVYNSRGATISIGDDCLIKSAFLSNLVGLYSRAIIITREKDASIVIGNNVGISGATIYARQQISIGNNTAIGGNVKILDNDFHPVDPEARKRNDRSQIGTAPVKIGDNCFIGVNAIILKGTVLGDNCVVGAGAVVSGEFEAGSVIVGNPARVIRKIQVNQ